MPLRAIIIIIAPRASPLELCWMQAREFGQFKGEKGKQSAVESHYVFEIDAFGGRIITIIIINNTNND
jgi:hypothetical protein